VSPGAYCPPGFFFGVELFLPLAHHLLQLGLVRLADLGADLGAPLEQLGQLGQSLPARRRAVKRDHLARFRFGEGLHVDLDQLRRHVVPGQILARPFEQHAAKRRDPRIGFDLRIEHRGGAPHHRLLQVHQLEQLDHRLLMRADRRLG
jgi:hypothetical protein